MNLSNVFINVSKVLKSNSPQILTAIGVTGVVSTAYLASKATIEATDIIRANEAVEGTHSDRKERIKERTKHVWKLYIPAVVSGGATIACVVCASRVGARRTAAAVATYSLTERAFSEYKEKVVEQIGEGKEKKLRDEIVKDRMKNNPETNVIVTGDGEVKCCELYTGRYFKSDMETLKRSENRINYIAMHERYATLDDFYDLVGLGGTCVSGETGWDADKLMELEYTTVLSENGEPCLAFTYNYVKPLH